MAYVNVAEWSPDQVSEWLKGEEEEDGNVTIFTSVSWIYFLPETLRSTEKCEEHWVVAAAGVC